MIEREPLKKDARESKEKDTTGLKETDVMGFKGKGAEGLGEKPEVCCDPSLFRQNAILTPLEKGEGLKGFGRLKKGKETEQAIKTGKDEKAPNLDIPPPVPTLQPLPKVGGNERPTHSEPSLRPLPGISSTFPSSSPFVNPKLIN